MKKIFSKYLLILLTSLSIAGCGDFGDLNVDPNKPATTDNRFLFINAARNMRLFHIVGTYNPFPQHFTHYWAERQNVQYTVLSLNSYSTTDHYRYTIKDFNYIIEYNTDEKTKNQMWVTNLGANTNQIGVCRTLRAFTYMHLTDVLGMIPYSEAFKGNEGHYYPKYDSQEAIYADLDKELTEAYAQFNTSLTFNKEYDIFYKGDIAKWKKFNASVRMLLAIKMSKVDPVNGKKRFAAAYADGGITDNNDNFNYYYLPEANNENPLYNNIFVGKRADFAPSETIVDILKKYNDPRLTAYFMPNRDGDIIGVPFGMIATDLSKYDYPTKASSFTPRFTDQNAVGTLTSAAQMLLHSAEAAALGWISADVNELYTKGIEASFNLNKLDVTTVPAYMSHAEIALTAGDTQNNIKKISMQKWIQGFGEDCFEAWAEWRRNRVPDLKIGPAAGASLEGKPMPDRMFYASGDYTTNKAEYDKAIATQGTDNFFTKLWWGK